MVFVVGGGGGFPDRYQTEVLPLPRFPPFSSGDLFPHRSKCHIRVRSRLSSNIDRASLKKDKRKGRGIYRETAKEGEKGSRGGGGGIPVDSLVIHRHHRSPTFSSTTTTHTQKSSIYFPIMKTAAGLDYNPGLRP